MLLKGNLRYADNAPNAWLGYLVQATYELPPTAIFAAETVPENAVSKERLNSAPPLFEPTKIW